MGDDDYNHRNFRNSDTNAHSHLGVLIPQVNDSRLTTAIRARMVGEKADGNTRSYHLM